MVYLFVLVLLMLSLDTLWSTLFTNLGWVLLSTNYSFVDSEAYSGNAFVRAKSLFGRSLIWDSERNSTQRGLGFVYWYEMLDLWAADMWDSAGLTATDYVTYGQRAASEQTALRWYQLARHRDPGNERLWLVLGQRCQQDPSISKICDDFLVHTGDNWFVDASFVFGAAGWHFNRIEGAEYAVARCPDLPETQCASIRIETVTSPNGTSWHQCVTLEPGRSYQFSTWIKSATEGTWIPLYYQGALDGKPKGYALRGTYTDSTNWTYLEQVFIAPELDGQRACFHPVRLFSLGQVWFHSAELRMVP
jgi:hypothetical protein